MLGGGAVGWGRNIYLEERAPVRTRKQEHFIHLHLLLLQPSVCGFNVI